MVSHRWKDLGLQLIRTRPNLEFDIPNIFGISIGDGHGLIAEDFSKQDFAKRANKVLKLHDGNKVDSFKVKFFFNRESVVVLDEWI